ncbi:TraR/DksA C4-type zinc finger protein [Streptomyces durmitorensis]|uniref:TraR/DksA C4-type zinc finger protein n=1 Tax=Streptomyces durmitorensis TaxID=319947 RepID=A0ABY4PRD2_9ACTN|nr:TraR/DksA C4-type zinc finger protein [Streptomyces durmitorensis]UQT56296.1 TraR/DksA C4-type zinc finger protein [Streptomyces durmitorensis]
MSLPTHTPPAEAHPGRLTPREARRRLEHERGSRLAQLRAIGETGHEADEQVMAAQKDTLERVLKEIGAALDRVRDGSYGTCPGCSRPIPVERLEILPYTKFCVPCQRKAD